MVFICLFQELHLLSGAVLVVLSTKYNLESLKKREPCQMVVVLAFNPSSWEVEAGGSLCSRPTWSTE